MMRGQAGRISWFTASLLALVVIAVLFKIFHRHTPHLGIVAPVAGGGGYLELKLDYDTGDLELWLAKDEGISQPWTLPLDSEIEVEFTGQAGRNVQLRVRNRENNEDKDGVPNVFDGKTNYFIYPTREGEDASWLKGKDFSSAVIVRFTADGKDVQSEEFVLTPRAH